MITLHTLTLLAFLLGVNDGNDQEDVLQRLKALEAENAELAMRIEALAATQENFDLGGLAPPSGESHHGLGPAASKIYEVTEGLSIGGYGEFVYDDFQGGRNKLDDFQGESNQFDAKRAVLYFGYRFSDKWLLNTEIEIEHADEIFLEFAHLDYLHDPALNGRFGLILHPMGFLNEQHEPDTYLGAQRPLTESRIIPTTWRENGAGVFGESGDFAYRAYVLNGFDGMGFSDSGLRGGRQKGSKALANDLAVTARMDYVGTPGLLAGVSGYVGDSGQDDARLDGTGTSILEAHAEWKADGLWLRALYAMASVDDVAELNAANGFTGADSVGEELEGFYVEGGYDVLQLMEEPCGAALYPFLRYERIDTQAEVPTGFSSAESNDLEIITMGLHYQPIDHVVFKLDYQDYDGPTADRWNLQIGYSF
ncbi:MAG: hypothetical protein ACI8QS_000322 [Planctomycetota bacterium]|jgi:hypothetical protein